ncbi:MAG: hypothetical protein RL662_713 [Bacteroidota bacterium]
MCISAILVILSSLSLNAQNKSSQDEKKGYVGLSIGVNIPSGGFGNNTDVGYTFNVNGGYLLHKRIGIAATYYTSDLSTSFHGLPNYYDDDDDANFSLKGFMVGPLFSYPIKQTPFTVDAKLLVGMSHGELPDHYEYLHNSKEDFNAFSYGGGISFKWNCIPQVALSLNYDLISMRPNLDRKSYWQTPNQVAQLGKHSFTNSLISIGGAYRF